MTLTPIKRSDPDFDAAVCALASYTKQRSVCIFAGAGISAPSGLPLSRHLIDSLVEELTRALEAHGLPPQKHRDRVKKFLKGRPLEKILEAMIAVHGPIALRCIDVLGSGEPNFSHVAVAQLAAAGMLRYIITLNFDVLFEQALLREGVSFEWHLPRKLPRQVDSSKIEFPVFLVA